MPGGRGARVWLGLAVSALFLGLLFVGVDRDELWESLREVDARWLLAAAPVYAAALWLRAARWRRILWPELPIGARETFAPMLVGYAANNVLPARAGEVLRALILKRRHGTSRSAAVGTIVVERALDGLVLALALAGTVALAGGSGAAAPARGGGARGVRARDGAPGAALAAPRLGGAARPGTRAARRDAAPEGAAGGRCHSDGAALGAHHAPRPARLVGGPGG